MRLRTLLIAAVLAGGFVYLTSHPDSPLRRAFAPSDSPLWSGPNTAHSAGLGSDEQNNIDVYKGAREAVVYVTSTVVQRTFFFGDQVGKELGSGFIVNANGEILTNNHVISGSQRVEVMLPDQTRYPATILARDPPNDLSLIKIQPKKQLHYLPLGDSDRIQVGQKVLAIGQPLGLEGTLTTGIVSSLGRTIGSENGRELEGMIQTDAAINQGNSGGPLLDSSGNVIGINTAIYSQGTGGSIGIGFAMPINRAKTMLEAFRTGKNLEPAGPLGVQILYVAGDWAEALRLPSSGGILIDTVRPGSAASQAGLRGGDKETVVGNYRIRVGGDLITAIDGKAVTSEDALARAISRKHAGDVLDLTVLRNSRSTDVKVTLAPAAETRF